MKDISKELEELEILTIGGYYTIVSATFLFQDDMQNTQDYRITLGEKMGRDDIFPENLQGTSGECIVQWSDNDWDITYFGEISQY
jgi:hypothetical protein